MISTIETFWGNPDIEQQFDVEKSRELLEKLKKSDDQVTYLDLLESERSEEYYLLTKILQTYSPQGILEHFQESVLPWLTANSFIQDDAIRNRDGLETLMGFDVDLFERARLWQWRNARQSRSGIGALSHYQIMEAVHNGDLDDLDLQKILRTYAKEGIDISEKRADRYTLAPLRIRRPNSDGKRAIGQNLIGYEEVWGQPHDDVSLDIYLDTPTAIGLLYKGMPQALVAIAPEGLNEITIHQLQGVKGMKVDSEQGTIKQVSARGLAVVDWQGVLVEVVEQIARKLGKSRLSILPGDKNMWTKPQFNEEKPHLTQEQAYASYDKQAQRLGFGFCEEDRLWVKCLQD